MPSPIPRNRSAGDRQPRRPASQPVWSRLLFRRPQENIGPPPPQVRPPARHRATPGQPFRRPQENIGPPPPQVRPPARHRATPGQPFRRPRGDAGPPARPRARPGQLFRLFQVLRRPRGRTGPPGPRRPPNRARPGTEVMVGVLILAGTVFAVWIAVPLSPSENSSGFAAPPVGGHADVATPDGEDPGLARDQLTVPPGPLAGPIPVSEARHSLITVAGGDGLPVAAGQPGSAAQPSLPGTATNTTDRGQQVPPPAVEHLPRHAAQPATPGPTEQVPPQEPKPKPPVDQPPASPAPKPKPQREQLEAVARALAKLQQGRNGDKPVEKPAPPPQKRPGSDGPNGAGGSPGGKTNSPKQSGGGGKQGVSRQSGSGSTP